LHLEDTDCNSRDLPFSSIGDLPDVYTNFRKSVEPLRSRPRPSLSAPAKLLPLPSSIPPQLPPFTVPKDYVNLESALVAPLNAKPDLDNPPDWPPDAQNSHPFPGGETAAQARLLHLLKSGSMTAYKDTRNGLIGEDYSTKLSAWLALGCITARQIHQAMVEFEDGRVPASDVASVDEWHQVHGFGEGENSGTAAVRFELLWRDYMRLCARKFGARLFHLDGFRDGAPESENNRNSNSKSPRKWKLIDHSTSDHENSSTIPRSILQRFLSGRTGTGLIDASQRELLLTGYTSNRARQNVASFLTSHLGIDWRLGAEWYESLLVDYDVSSNWGNWQYVAGVGNDPREGRIFNPVKQALDYDGEGEFVKAWVPELRSVEIEKDGEEEGVDNEKLMGLFQAWRLPRPEKERLSLCGLDWVENPLVKIPFSVNGKRPEGAHIGGYRGRGRNGWWRGRGRGRGRGDDRLRRKEQDGS
jgi:deoxyribodipyrimidine photo-lyase